LKIPVLETDIEEFRQAIDDLEKSNDDKTRKQRRQKKVKKDEVNKKFFSTKWLHYVYKLKF